VAQAPPRATPRTYQKNKITLREEIRQFHERDYFIFLRGILELFHRKFAYEMAIIFLIAFDLLKMFVVAG